MEFDNGILEAPLMINEHDCAVLAPLHVSYMRRGEDLQDLDLYSYAGIVSVKKKRAELAQEEPGHDSDFESGTNRRRRRGRRANGRYAFEDIEGLRVLSLEILLSNSCALCTLCQLYQVFPY